jgi:aminopeptidase N
MRARWLAIVLLGTACGEPPPEPPPTGPMAVTVDRYDFSFDLDPYVREGRARVEATITTGGDCLSLPMRAERLGDVLLDGVVARATLADGVLTACGDGRRAGEPLVLETGVRVPLATWGDSQVGYSYSADSNDEPYWYLVSWVEGCDRFGPCDTRPGTFARYRFTVTHPEGVEVLCSGDVTAGATETSCAFEYDGGPTYSTFGLVASSGWETVALGEWNGITVTAHNRRGSSVIADIDDAFQAGFLAFMEERFGPYPYGDELRLITLPTYWSGFEHPGNIVLDDRLGRPSAYADPIDHVLAHELAHQWAGDQATLADTYDFVWKEAMAEYLAFVYEDEVAPTVALSTARAWKSFAAGAAFHPVPEERPPLLDYYGEVYGPGPMVLFRQLEGLFSRAAILDALATLLGAPRALSVDDVRLALEATTGADLTGYFARWVIGDGAPAWPVVTIATEAVGAGQVAVTATQRPGVPPAGCAFTVRLLGDGGASADARLDFGVDGAESASATVAADFAITDWQVDPLAECLVYEAAPGAAPAPRHPRGWSPWRADHPAR